MIKLQRRGKINVDQAQRDHPDGVDYKYTDDTSRNKPELVLYRTRIADHKKREERVEYLCVAVVRNTDHQIFPGIDQALLPEVDLTCTVTQKI